MDYEKAIEAAYKRAQRAKTEAERDGIWVEIRQLQAARKAKDGKGWGGNPRK